MFKWSLALLSLLVLAVVADPAARGDEDPIYSGFIKKGGLTGNVDKLLNVNLFISGRFSHLDDDGIAGAYGRETADNVSVPGARLYLTGQVYTDLFYKVAYEFSNESDLDPNNRNGRLTDAMLTWRLPLVTDLVNRLDFNVGLGPVFLSPTGEQDTFFLDTIESPLIVQNILPPGWARDTGMYFKGSFLDGDILQVWAGFYNGTHRLVGVRGNAGVVPAAFSPEVDAWGTGTGQATENFAGMGRIQVNVLNEEGYFLMFSGGVSINTIRNNINGLGVARNVDDELYSAATELRFNDRLTWVKSELLYARTEHYADLWGFHVTAGHRLTFLPIENFEVVARFEQQELEDSRSSVDDLWSVTAGLNYYFDPKHQHDGKFQLNYIHRDPADGVWARGFGRDNSLLFQFVIGF